MTLSELVMMKAGFGVREIWWCRINHRQNFFPRSPLVYPVTEVDSSRFWMNFVDVDEQGDIVVVAVVVVVADVVVFAACGSST